LASELAKRGQNIVIIGRNVEKLRESAQKIRDESPKVTVETLQMDLSHMSKEDKSRYLKCIEDKDVGVLVNNAGLSYPYVQYFHEVEEALIEDIVEVNSKVPTWLAYATMPKFLKKNKGAVINISSASSVTPHELHEVYAGSKAYLNKWTADMALSYTKNISKDLTFQTQLPFFVVSNMSKIRKSSLFVPSAEAYARASVAQIGYSGQISPYPIHAIIYFLLSIVPYFIQEMYIGSLHQKVRRRAKEKDKKGH